MKCNLSIAGSHLAVKTDVPVVRSAVTLFEKAVIGSETRQIVSQVGVFDGHGVTRTPFLVEVTQIHVEQDIICTCWNDR